MGSYPRDAGSGPCIFAGLQVWNRFSVGGLSALIAMATLAVMLRYLPYVELTAQGVDIHYLGTTHVPWQSIGSVARVRKYGGYQLNIYDHVQKRNRRLLAPCAAFGVGRREQEEARELIEHWRLAYRGSRPPMAARRSSGVGSDPTVDPYRPPPEG